MSSTDSRSPASLPESNAVRMDPVRRNTSHWSTAIQWRERARSTVRIWTKRAAFAFLRTASLHYRIHGLSVYLNYATHDARERARANITAALGYLHTYDPVRLGRVCRDLRNGVLTFPTRHSNALYHRDVDVCILNSDCVLNAHPAFVALLIVHEATHARLRCVSNATPERRARMERICIGAQIALASRVPGGAGSADALRREQEQIEPNDFP